VAAALGPTDEIVVVDSASADPSAVLAVAASSRARVLRCDAPGSARARNVGAAHASGEYVAFVDDDAVVESDWLTALVTGFSDPTVAAVVGPVFELGSVPPKLLLHYPTFRPDTDAIKFSRLDPAWFARIRFGAIGSGTNLAVRREAFERFGRFRECLGQGAPICGDETYCLLALVESGECVLNQPAARVHHPLQSAQRLHDLQESRVAYLLYVLMTRPGLRWQVAKSLLRSRERTAVPARDILPASLPSLGRASWETLRLLAAARRIDRECLMTVPRQL
jgi:GT2 family glycosyltransferase